MVAPKALIGNHLEPDHTNVTDSPIALKTIEVLTAVVSKLPSVLSNVAVFPPALVINKILICPVWPVAKVKSEFPPLVFKKVINESGINFSGH